MARHGRGIMQTEMEKQTKTCALPATQPIKPVAVAKPPKKGWPKGKPRGRNK